MSGYQEYLKIRSTRDIVCFCINSRDKAGYQEYLNILQSGDLHCVLLYM